jgi:hypothetical protein
MEQKAARFGIRLNTVNLPRPPADVDERIERYLSSFDPSG